MTCITYTIGLVHFLFIFLSFKIVVTKCFKW